MKDKRWISRAKTNPEKVQELISKLNAPRVVAEILVSRGMDTPEKVKTFYNPKLSQLHDPFLMKDMDKAINRINRAKEAQEKVMIYGDYDVDGTTSVALTFGFFKDIFDEIQYYIPDRYKEGYGISQLGIDTAANDGVSLIIALDCGIRSVELVDYAASQGIDFIICDHHLPGEQIPNAVAVLDPKRQDCEYPFKELCGCGIGFKLIQAYTEFNNLDKNIVLQQLDLVTLAIASDIVPIVGENRILAHYGLRLINSSPRPGIAKLIEIAINKPKLSIGDLVFYVGPRINAAGRMDSALDAVSLLLQEDHQKAEEQAKILHTHNTSRQAVDEKITAEIQEIVHQNPGLLERKTLVFYKEDWHKGVVGIAASRAIELYYRPTIILTKSGDVLAGSARSVKGFDVHEALVKCKDHLLQFGGHMYAAGMSLLPENLDAFRDAFEQAGNEALTDEILTPRIDYDAEIGLDEINNTLLESIERMAPFGPGNMTPVLKASGLKDDGSGRIIGKTREHIRLNVAQQSNRFAAVGFGMADKFDSIKKADSLEACFQINENVFNGNRSIQLMLKDIRPTNGA